MGAAFTEDKDMSRFAKFCVVAAGLSISLAACTTLQVTTDVNPNFSVASCHSYTFAMVRVGGPDAAFSNPLNADRLRVSIESGLAARGITKASDPAAADCKVGYALGTRQVFSDYYAGWGVGWGYGGYGWGRRGWGGYWGYDGPWVENETRIVIDVFDNRSKQPIWHGAVSQSISDLTGPNAEARIGAAAQAIIAKMPIGTAPAVAGQAPPAAAAAAMPAPAPAPSAQPAGFFIYPKNGQSAQQQTTDQQQCGDWATQQAHGTPSGTDYRRAMAACLDGRGYSVN
jgi:Domain of unknown function (DUF4136)